MHIGLPPGLLRGLRLLAVLIPVTALAQHPIDLSAQPMVISTAALDWSSCTRPTYPPEALNANEQGTTVLRYIVRADRTLSEPHVERSSGYERLDRAAVEAFSKCRGIPALLNGAPVPSYTRINFNWKIADQRRAMATMDAQGRMPSYPEEAIREERQGTTKMRFTVNERGYATQAEVLESSGSDALDTAAMSALVACRFKPATDSADRAVLQPIVMEYVWKLQ